MILEKNSGHLMLVSELHGDWEDYSRAKQIFSLKHKKGEADYLVLMGDIIHSSPGRVDRSKEILDDVLLEKEFPIICLLGNHEFVHIYHIALTNEKSNYTENLEQKIASKRHLYTEFFSKMPYSVSTSGGVLVNHAGASASLAGVEKFENLSLGWNTLANYDCKEVLLELEFVTNRYIAKKRDIGHSAYSFRCQSDILGEVDVSKLESQRWWKYPLSGLSQAAYNPWWGRLFLASELGMFWWEVFFNMNELQYMDAYPSIVDVFLKKKPGNEMSFLVSGHTHLPQGYKTIGSRQLCFSSSHSVENKKDKSYLMLEASRNYKSLEELREGIHSLYP